MPYFGNGSIPRSKGETSQITRNEFYQLRRMAPSLTAPELKYKIAQLLKKEAFLIFIDNFLKVSIQKLDFIRFLSDSRFRIVTAVESSCAPSLFLKLRVRCREHAQITLPRLTQSESMKLIDLLAVKTGLSLGEPTIRWLAKVYRGYPLMIVEGVRHYRDRNTEPLKSQK
jgi:hypothetical protein